MDLRAIIDEIASQADDFLAGDENRAEARAAIAAKIAAAHPALAPADRGKVADGVMAILEEEGFLSPGRNPATADDTNGD